LPPDIGRRWSERYGTDILDGLGSTEMLHIFLSNRPDNVKYGTTGKPVPGYDIRLVDDDGEPIKKRGDMGELQVRGPTSAIMYWNNREQSRSTFLGEWTRSGDKYVEDPDGYFVYCGRRDDMLKVSGMYVSPFEVEGVLQSHPDVLEAAVVGWPDTDELIKPKAFVVLKVPAKASDAFAQVLQENRDRQDPALQAARRGRGEVILVIVREGGRSSKQRFQRNRTQPCFRQLLDHPHARMMTALSPAARP
jgi:benzoate-CoA ligase